MQDLKSTNMFCESRDPAILETMSPRTFYLFYLESMKLPNNPASRIVIDRYKSPTITTCLKVDSLRVNGFKDLSEWMSMDLNLYVGRKGRIFITLDRKDQKNKEIFDQIQRDHASEISEYHHKKFTLHQKPALPKIASPYSIRILKNGSFNVQVYFSYKQSKFYNPFTVREYGREQSLIKYKQYLINSGLSLDLEEIRGRNLGCFCKPDEACHAKVLIKLLKEAEFKGSIR
jgi:hypothetical protein